MKYIILLISFISIFVPLAVFNKRKNLWIDDEYKALKNNFIALCWTMGLFIVFVALAMILLNVRI